MIKFNDELFKQILEKLSDLYPDGVQQDKDLLPENSDRKEVLKHLIFCWEKEWVSASAIGERSLIVPIEFHRIKITCMGIEHLFEITKKPTAGAV